VIARALTIAGSDSGGGAGIQQDLKTFMAFGAWGMTAITAVTVQNTIGVSGFVELPPQTVAEQIHAVASDIGVDGAKTGMLASAAIVEAVARAIRDAEIDKLVVDPVFISKHGDPLLHADAVEALRREIIPLALCVTPNAHEAGQLAGGEVRTRREQIEAARTILTLGARAVLVKGGHVEGDAVDVLATKDGVQEFAGPRIDSPNTHGTGCMLSAAIAAGLAHGRDLQTSIRDAKEFVTGGIGHSLAIGKGIGPVNPMWRAEEAGERS
jgi:hydroxymethylpyrimidine/phosphomethylpyrimidine kinase